MPFTDDAPTSFSAGLSKAFSCGVARLQVAFFSGDESTVTVDRTGVGVRIAVDAESCELTRSEAAALRSAIGDALAHRIELVRTVGVHRSDGSYVVARRAGTSAGNRQVFETFDDLRSLYGRLPATFDAEAVGEEGFTGSRRHLLVRHFTEHPRFDCELVCDRPLTAQKAPLAERR